MSKKTFIIILVVILLIFAGYLLFYGKKSYQPPVTTAPDELTVPTTPAPASPTTPTAPTADPTKPAEEPAQPPIITYTNSGFSPNPLKIRIGTTVTFKNNASKGMWVASAMHPTHKVYPTTGGCIGSTFDTCGEINPGASWPFKFNIVGNWKYHNHVNPSHFGAIIVE